MKFANTFAWSRNTRLGSSTPSLKRYVHVMSQIFSFCAVDQSHAVHEGGNLLTRWKSNNKTVPFAYLMEGGGMGQKKRVVSVE